MKDHTFNLPAKTINHYCADTTPYNNQVVVERVLQLF